MTNEKSRIALAASALCSLLTACFDAPPPSPDYSPFGTAGSASAGGTTSAGGSLASAGSGFAAGQAGSFATGGTFFAAGTGGSLMSGGGGAGAGGLGGDGGGAAAGTSAGGGGGMAGGATTCPAGLTGAGVVKVMKNNGTFSLTRDGAPYYIKGIAGGSNLALAQQYGVNSTRTFGSDGIAGILDDAKSHCMTVLLGIGLSQKPEDYSNADFTNGKRAEVTSLLATIKDHPALLMWALGNEINLGADNQTAWTFVNELASLIHQQDSNHPVISVLAGANVTAINHIVQWAPSIDAIGINSYAGVVGTNGQVDKSNFAGPIVITEWGPTGHWECPNTSWGRPIEETSGAKGRVYKTRYDSFAHTGRILGDYVFLWGQKIERTPTWYGMFLETNADLGLNGESLPTVDTMASAWSGTTVANRAPDVTALELSGQEASANVVVGAGQQVQAQVTVTEPDGDTLSYVWEVLEDPAQPDLKGAPEPREPRVGSPQKGTMPSITITAPSQAGQYRLLVYVLDGKGHAGTANIPFRVN
ncbi:MAG TPA: hypothetical protein VHB79_07970 [Polyangiaceae bacterium]|nr:hypothetical protein [Polyangiaceae bacterium]